MATINVKEETHEVIKSLTFALLMTQSEVIDFLVKETFAAEFVQEAVKLKENFPIYIQVCRAKAEIGDVDLENNKN
ncbi:MAG: hypothetical protein ACYC2U_04660 [Candidatus Amoebophilus sp.]